MATNGFGVPKYGGNTTFAKNVRLKEGANTVVRILPPMKSLAEKGEWATYFGTHFGYRGVNSKDRAKPTFRPFKCVEERDWKTQMFTRACPECDLIAARKAELKALQDSLKAQKKPQDEIDEECQPLADWLSDHNCDRKWHMNVMLPDNSFAVLALSHKTKKLLEAEISRVMAEDNIEALFLDQGVWFRFTRTGKGIDTQDTVTVEYETIRGADGRVTRTVKLAPLTDAQAEKALKECPDLTMLTRELSTEQITMLTECSGDDEEVDRIFSLGEREASPARQQPSQVLPKSQPKATPVATPAAAVEAAEGDDEEAALLAQMAALKAKKAAQAAVKIETEAAVQVEEKHVDPTPATVPAAAVARTIDRASFMARFPKGTKAS